MSTPRVLVVLSGCGFLDGSEIHESVLALLFLDRAGATVTCAAPDKAQIHVVNHVTNGAESGTRNVLIESARIARGNVVSLAMVSADNFDAVVLPGGYGAAKNLSSVATQGANASVDADLLRLLRAFRAAQKPICALCISPAVVVAALREGVVTIGNDPGTAGAIAAMGGTHQEQPVTGVCIDQARKLVTTPAYMYDARVAEVAVGIEAAIGATLRLV